MSGYRTEQNIKRCNSTVTIFKVFNVREIKASFNLLSKKFQKYGITFKKSKIQLYNLVKKTKFDWLGYTFLIMQALTVYRRKNFKDMERFHVIQNQYNLCKLFCYISNNYFFNLKYKFKLLIKKLKFNKLEIIINKVNNLIFTVIKYYNFADNFNRLNYLFFYINRLFWKVLIEKYKYQGIRRTRWIAKTFFSTTRSPVGKKWHLHIYKFSKKKIYIQWLAYFLNSCYTQSFFFKKNMTIKIN